MSLTVGIHPDEFEIRFFDQRPGDARPFVSLEAREGDGTVTVYLASVAQCDELIRAAVEAGRLLLGEPMQPVCGAIAEHTGVTCELPAGHKEDPAGHEDWHRAGQLVWPQEPDLAAAEASRANPYGSSTGLPGTGNRTDFVVEDSGSSKHGRYDAGSAAEVAEGVEPLTPDEAESIRSGYLPPSAVPKVSETMRRNHGVSADGAR